MLHAPQAETTTRAENVYFNTVVGPINLARGGVLSRDDERIGHVIRWISEHDHGGSIERSALSGMFYTQDLAIILLEQGRVEDFLRMFYCVLGADVTQETLSTAEWRRNCQPHCHSISGLVRIVRTMLVQERDGALILLQGTPRRWLEPGKEIRIQDAPTWYGPLSLEARAALSGKSLALRLKLPERLGSTAVRLRLRLPREVKMDRVVCNGKGMTTQGEWLELTGRTGSLHLEVDLAKVQKP